MTHDTDLLVVGAGSTGLTLALQAAAHGARVRVVERRSEPQGPSPTVVLHPRSLELLRPLGVTEALLARGERSVAARLHLRSRVVSLTLGPLELPGTAFPHLLRIRQGELEEVLSAALAERGAEVEYGVEVVRVARVGAGGARAVLRRAGRPDDEVHCRFLAGCDGPTSLVRRSVGGWIGGDDSREAVLADVDLGPAATVAGGRAVEPVLLEADTAHVGVGRRGVAVLVPPGAGAGWRMHASRPAAADLPPAGEAGAPVSRTELQHLLDDAALPARVEAVAWSAEVRVQHRLASRFSRGPLFVAGEAAHVHPPVGGQGVNAGIHDAVNLGWKLGFAAGASSTARPALLDSYHQERRRADRAVLQRTHALYRVAASPHPLAQLARVGAVPLIAPMVPFLLRQPRVSAAVVRTLAQLRLRYARSPLSMEVPASGVRVRGGLARRGLRPGSRVADTLVRCAGRRVRLHELINEPGVHILLQADAAAVPERMLGPLVHAYRLDDRPGTGMLVVRPDGYAALRAPVFDEASLVAWLRLVGLAEG